MDPPPATRAMRSRRLARCAGCGLDEALCLCAAMTAIAVRTRVVVVAHRNEVHKTSNTGKLAVRLLEGASMLVRGTGAELSPPPDQLAARRLVLFPAPGARTLRADDLTTEGLVLVVPDGSWTQARKVLRREALAEGAESVTLPPGPPSRYALRRAPHSGDLCTLEAIARALGVLEHPAIERRLLVVLDAFVARHRAIRKSVPRYGSAPPAI